MWGGVSKRLRLHKLSLVSHTCNPALRSQTHSHYSLKAAAGRSRVQGVSPPPPWLHWKFKASLDYMKLKRFKNDAQLLIDLRTASRW